MRRVAPEHDVCDGETDDLCDDDSAQIDDVSVTLRSDTLRLYATTDADVDWDNVPF